MISIRCFTLAWLIKAGGLILLGGIGIPAFSQSFPVSPNAYDANSQRTGHWTILYDSTFQKEVKDPDSAFYYRLVRFENGKPSGKVRDFYRSGVKQWEGYLLSLQPIITDGEVSYFFENGKKSHYYLSKAGKKDGFYKEYAPNGTLVRDGFFQADSAEGTWTSYSPEGVKLTEVKYRQNRVSGNVLVFFPSGKIQRSGYKVNNKTEGWWDEFYESGQLKSHERFHNAQFQGPAETYFENGKIETQGSYADNEKSGIWFFYFDNGNLSHTGSYENGIRTGLWKSYYTDGNLKFMAERKNDKLDGSYTEYYPSGKIKLKSTCQNDWWQGLLEKYYENGQLEKRGHYIADSLEGQWVFYHENGNKSSEGRYINNKKDGPWKYYRLDGSLETEETFSLGSLNGPTANYFANGKKEDQKEYLNGKQTGDYTAYYENGNLREQKIFLQGNLHGNFTEYYEDGKIKTSGSHTNGIRNGEWRWYFANGQLNSSEQYTDGKWNGRSISYYTNGNRRAESTGVLGKEEGNKKIYFTHGLLKGEGNMHVGKREGVWVFYDSLTGKKESEGKYVNSQPHGWWVFPTSNPHRLHYIYGYDESFSNVADSIKVLADTRITNKAWQKLKRLSEIKKYYAPDKRKNNDLIFWKAYILAADKKYEQAFRQYDIYLNNLKKIKGDNQYDYASAINNQALILSDLGRASEAISLLHSLDSLYEKWGDNRNLAHLENLANQMDLRQKETYLLQLLHARKKSEKAIPKNTLYLILKLGNLYAEETGEYEKGIRTYQSLLAYADSVNLTNDFYCGMAQYKIAGAYRSMYDRTHAFAWAKKAISILSAQMDRFVLEYLDNLNLLGNIYLEMNKTDSARLVFSHMMAVAEKGELQTTISYAKALDGLAEAYFKLYDYTRAKQLWQQEKSLLEAQRLIQTNQYVDALQALSIILPMVDTKDTPLAEKYLLQAVELARQISNEGWKYRKMLQSLAAFYVEWGRYAEAKKIVEKNINLTSEAEGKTENYIDNLSTLGDIYFFQDYYQQSIPVYEKALHLADSLKKQKPVLYITALSNLGSTYDRLNQFEKAEQYMRQSAEAGKALLGEENITTIVQIENLASVLKKDLRYSEAEKYYKEARELIAKTMGRDNLKYAYSTQSLGSVYNQSGQYKKALEYYSQYVNQIIKLKGKISVSYVKALDDLANVYTNLNNPQQAEKLYAESIKLSLPIYGRKEENYAWRLKKVGEFYLDQQKYFIATRYLEEARQLARTHIGAESFDYANFLVSLSKAKSNTDQFKEAEELLLSAVDIYKKNIQNRFGSYIGSVEQLVSFYERFGQYDVALRHIHSLLPLIAKYWRKEERYIQNLITKSSLHYGLGQYDSTEAVAARALAMAEEQFASTHWLVLKAHTDLGRAAIKTGKYDEARKQFQFCVDQRKITGQTRTTLYATDLQNLAVACMEGEDFALAEKYLNEAEQIDIQNGSTEGLDYIHLNQGKLYQATGRPALAEKYFKNAMNSRKAYIERNFYFLSDNQKAQFWKANRFFMEYFQSFAARQQKQNPLLLHDLYNVQLATKGILLSASNKIKKRILTSGDSVMITHYYQWLKQRNELAQLYLLPAEELKIKKPTIDSLENLVSTTEKDLNISAEDLEKDKGRNVRWQEIQRALSPHEAAVEIVRIHHHTIHPTDSVFYIALVLTAETKANPAIVMFPNGKNLETKALRYYKNAIAAQLTDTLSYRSYWWPLQALLKNKTHIYLSQDGVYNSINLNTLRTADGDYLLEAKTITLVANTKEILQFKKKNNTFNRATAVLVGHPVFFMNREKVKQKIGHQREVDFASLSDEDRSGIADLPGTQTEINKVDTILTAHRWQVKTYTEENATERALKKTAQPKVLHIATHGFFSDKNDAGTDPMLRAGLLLTGVANYLQDNITLDADNGILTAYEAANLNLDNTEMVVLSACETGKGEVQNGEGVYGLQRAFQTAGAQSILMSLWKVDDAATQELMTLFYQNWAAGKTKADAFTLAQRSLKKKYNSPYYWGAFVMMGK